ncbi:MAG TPA: hypothetical protein VKE42_12410 [Candidatus Cybelea sp.]|nr:hypothetical protein [Candidatus Cybelea sp.]
MTNKIMTWLMMLAAMLVGAIIFAAGMLIHNAQAQQATFTDRDGRFSGSSITHGNKTDFYDGRGRYQGTTTQQGTASNPLGNVDHSKPFGPRK